MSDQELDCNNPTKCRVRLPIDTVVSVVQNQGRYVESDCSLIMLLIVDEAGKVDINDNASLDYTSVDDRLKSLSSIGEVDRHYSACSRTHYELSAFFRNNQGVMVRPGTISVVYYDRAGGETMLDALGAVYSCTDCFNVVTHLALDSEGNSLMDTPDQLELAAWGAFHDKHIVNPSHNYTDAIVATEVTSNAALSKANGDWSTSYILTSDICVPVLDDDCEPTDDKIDTVGAEHIGLASAMASISQNADSYAFTLKFKPRGGLGIGGSDTSFLTAEETKLATGYDGKAGGLQEASNHHFNVYHNVDGHKMILEGLTATGLFIDDAMQRTYAKSALAKPLLKLLMNVTVLSLADLSKLQTRFLGVIAKFESQGFIAPEQLDLSDIPNVVNRGLGWYLTRDIGDIDLNRANRTTPHYTFCYRSAGGVHFVNMEICPGGNQPKILVEEDS